MATYFVSNGGDNTNGSTWGKAYTSLQTALTAATTAGDIVVIQYNSVPVGDLELSADTTYTTNNTNLTVLSASNNGGSSYTPTVMGTPSSNNWIGNSTTNRYIRLDDSDGTSQWYGITFRFAGSTFDGLQINGTGQQVAFYDCIVYSTCTAAGALINTSSSSQDAYATFTDSTIRFGGTGQYLTGRAVELNNCTIDSGGSAPSVLFGAAVSQGTKWTFTGCDLSHLGSSSTIVGNSNLISVVLDRCKEGASVTSFAAQTANPTKASGSLTILDCSSGDTHGVYEYHDALGGMTTETGIYFTSGAAGRSWKVVTSSLATRSTPFVTPWIDLHWSGTSAITPYIEILRDGSSTAYTDAEIWVEIAAKTTSGFTTATFSNDRQALASYLVNTAGSNQADGAGTGSWTGESGTAKSMKLGLGSGITPAEAGSMTARFYVAAASITVYIDPQIRT